MEKKRITILPHQYNNNDYFLLKFNYDEILVSIARSLGCRWVVAEEGWAIYRSRENLSSVIRAFSDISIVDTSKLGKVSLEDKDEAGFKDVPQEYSQALIRKGFNEEVRSIYRSMFREFVNHFKERKLREISQEEVRDYIAVQTRNKKISGQAEKQLIGAINLYFADILKRKELKYPLVETEKNETAQNGPSKKELARMLKVTKNPKHKAILSLLHSTGLKRSELIDLKKSDLDLAKKRVKAQSENDRESKAGAPQKVTDKKKDISLEKEAVDVLEHYLELYKPKEWLFEGTKGNKYADSSILSVLRRASFKAGLDRKIPKSKRNPNSEINWGS